MDDSLVFTLPLPPSANRMWRMGQGRMHKSAEYRAWKDAAAWQVAATMAGSPALKHYELRVILPPMGSDPDNALKGLGDALQAGGAIENDRHLRLLVLRVDDAREERETVLIELRAADGPAPKKRTRAKENPALARRAGLNDQHGEVK